MYVRKHKANIRNEYTVYETIIGAPKMRNFSNIAIAILDLSLFLPILLSLLQLSDIKSCCS